MLSEDVRVCDLPFAEMRRPPSTSTLAGTAEGEASASITTLDELLQAKFRYDEEEAAMYDRHETLWGPEEPYTANAEDGASFLQNAYYGWVFRSVLAASREQLTQDGLPAPTKDVRAHECGRRLSRSVQTGAYRRNAWKYFIGAEVVSTTDANSRGVLRWVGVPQQGEYKHVMAAVEWTVAPAGRVVADSADPAFSPFFEGVVHGEHLFTPHQPHCSTLEETKQLVLLLAPPTSEIGRAIAVPRRLSATRRLFTALPHYFWWQFPFKATGDVCTLIIPVLLGAVVNYFTNPSSSWGYGFFLVFSLFVVQAVQSCALHRYYYVSIKGGLQYRSALTTLIFEKCFTISSKAMAQPEINSGRIINMVSGDVERANDFMQYCMYLWSSPMVFIVSIALLGRLVGWCCLMAVLALALTMPINAAIMKRLMAVRQQLVKATDERVKATNEFLSGIRIAKFTTWEPRFIANIEAKRAVEIFYLKQVQGTRVSMSFLNISTPMIMIAVVFVLYHALGHELTPSIVFPTISLLGIIRMPFQMLPFVFTNAVQFFVSMARINGFLECDNASVTSVEDMEQYFAHHRDHSLPCQLAAVLENTEITAFVPLKLPFAPKIKFSRTARLLRWLFCGACSGKVNRRLQGHQMDS